MVKQWFVSVVWIGTSFLATLAGTQSLEIGTHYVVDANDAVLGPVLGYRNWDTEVEDSAQFALGVRGIPVHLELQAGLEDQLYQGNSPFVVAFEGASCGGTPYLTFVGVAVPRSFHPTAVINPTAPTDDLVIWRANDSPPQMRSYGSFLTPLGGSCSALVFDQLGSPAESVSTGFFPPYRIETGAGASMTPLSVPAVSTVGLILLAVVLATVAVRRLAF